MPTGYIDDWMTLWRGAADAAQTGVKLMEVGQASAEVIARRCRILAEAARDPLSADHREIGRLVPEKVDAMRRAGVSFWADWSAVHAELQAHWLHAATLALSGRYGPAQATASRGRAVRMAARSLGAGDRALAPVHARVTANARRLRNKQPAA